MSHRTIAKIAVAMVIVFGVTVLVYPMLFNPDSGAQAPVEMAPAPLPEN